MNENIFEILRQSGLSLSVDQQVAFQRAVKLVVLDVLQETIEQGILEGGNLLSIKEKYEIGA